MLPQMIALAQTGSALEAIRKDLIRCGFELEFQSVNGVEDSGEDDNGDAASPADEISAPHIEVGSDSSVRGGEARTVGALKPTEFMAAATALFTGHDFEIDTGCSFHIHLSVPGVRHSYGPRLQGEMMAYILENRHRLPASVQTRLQSKAVRFCMFHIDGDKMRAIHGHPQRTWEFRLFGNVDNALDAWKCLLLAIDALRHGYQVMARRAAPMLSPDLGETLHDTAISALKNKRTLTQEIRFNKLFKSKQSA
jgi:hypothetical protein